MSTTGMPYEHKLPWGVHDSQIQCLAQRYSTLQAFVPVWLYGGVDACVYVHVHVWRYVCMHVPMLACNMSYACTCMVY